MFEPYSCFKRVTRAGGPHKEEQIMRTPDVPLSDFITHTDIFYFLK